MVIALQSNLGGLIMTFIQSIVDSFQHDGLFIQLTWSFTALIAIFYLFVATLIILNLIRRIHSAIQSNREDKLRLKMKKQVSYPTDPKRDGLY